MNKKELQLIMEEGEGQYNNIRETYSKFILYRCGNSDNNITFYPKIFPFKNQFMSEL